MATSLVSTGVQFPDNTILTTALPAGIIVMWSGTVSNIPNGWNLCDGNNGTPNLSGLFVIGAGNNYSVNSTGGSANSVMVSHSHTAPTSTSLAGVHTHPSSHGHSGATVNAGIHNHPSATVSASPSGSHIHYMTADVNGVSDHVHPVSAQPSGNHFHGSPASNSTSVPHTHRYPGDTRGYVPGGGSSGFVMRVPGSGTRDEFALAGAHFHTFTSGASGTHIHPSNSTELNPSHTHTASVSLGLLGDHSTGHNITTSDLNVAASGVHSHPHPNAVSPITTPDVTSAGGTHSHSITLASPPGSSPGVGTNIPPYYSLAYIMKG